jgi:hypothetical protein
MPTRANKKRAEAKAYLKSFSTKQKAKSNQPSYHRQIQQTVAEVFYLSKTALSSSSKKKW